MNALRSWSKAARLMAASVPTAIVLAPAAARACPDCVVGRVARASVLDAQLGDNLALLTAPLAMIAAIAMVIHGTYRPSEVGGAAPIAAPTATSRARPLIAAGVVLGAGLGGFFDGIVLHQILQWHNMLSSRVPPLDLVSLKENMVWDGLFHACTWLMTVAGLTQLFRAARRSDVPWSPRIFIGSLALGWGLFNVIEGVIDHHILALHHVHPGTDQLAWDLGFLALGAALLVLGTVLVRRTPSSKRS